MNFTHFNGHFPAVHQFSAAKFTNPQIQPGAMIVTSASDGTIQYIRPEHNGTNFITTSASNSPVQSIPVTVNIPVPTDHRSGSIDQDVVTSQSSTQHQLAAVVNAPINKYPHAPSALLGWGEIPMMHPFGDASKNLTTLNVPYPHQAVNNGAFLTMQPPPTSVSAATGMWPVKLMQSVATMTYEDSDTQPQDLCKVEENKSKNSSNDSSKDSILKTEQKDSGDSDDSDDSSKSVGHANATTEDNRSESLPVPGNPLTNGSIECNQIQLQQQGSAMADYLARLPATSIPISLQHFLKYQTENTPSVKREGEAGNISGVFLGGGAAITPVSTIVPHNSQGGSGSQKKKKKKKTQKRPPRPKPGEIRLSTALDGSTLFCCPECHMAYPDRDLLQQHMSGHKLERRFVCNICGAGLKRKEHLDQHKRGHSDERPFVCSLCMKGFKRNEHLTRHFVIHSGEKTHACWECGKKFSRKDHLHKHTQTHIAKRVKAEMLQDNVASGTTVATAAAAAAAAVSGSSSTVAQSVLGALSPQIALQHSTLPAISHSLQMHHT